MRRILLAAMLFYVPLAAMACIWDRDTLAAEARDLSVIDAITGRFPRYPAEYYEVRLERVSKELAQDASRLDLYDDAGAACDRLGQGDEAIAWMARKKEQLEQAPDQEHQYRYHANLGTFLVHRWLRAGADAATIEEVREARNHIARAIEINPDAHFGREKYQLMALDWIIGIKTGAPDVPDNFLGLSAWHATEDNGELAKLGMPDAVKGLAGLIQLGDGWNSIDLFHALRRALQTQGDSSVASLAAYRVQELAAEGKTSLLTEAPPGLLEHSSLVENLEVVRRYYEKSRRNADAYHANLHRFLLAMLEDGKHPDTHPDVRAEHVLDAHPAPKPPGAVAGLSAAHPGLIPVILFAGIFGLTMIILAVVMFRMMRG